MGIPGPSDRRVAPMNRELPVTQALGRGLLSGRHGQHLRKEAIGRRVVRLGLVHDPAAARFPVAVHVPGGAPVPGDLGDGAKGLARRRPSPVVKTTTWAPPPTMPVTDSTSSP